MNPNPLNFDLIHLEFDIDSIHQFVLPPLSCPGRHFDIQFSLSKEKFMTKLIFELTKSLLSNLFYFSIGSTFRTTMCLVNMEEI